MREPGGSFGGDLGAGAREPGGDLWGTGGVGHSAYVPVVGEQP
ncbi:hypothetical protein [Dermatophilus congolensis]|nr:hypothetical protein [Dermatophilus congolensis]